MNELIGKEMWFYELDNYMVTKGYYSVFDDGVAQDIKNDLNVVYTNTTTNEAEVIVTLKITQDNAIDETIDAFILEVLSIDTM